MINSCWLSFYNISSFPPPTVCPTFDSERGPLLAFFFPESVSWPDSYRTREIEIYFEYSWVNNSKRGTTFFEGLTSTPYHRNIWSHFCTSKTVRIICLISPHFGCPILGKKGRIFISRRRRAKYHHTRIIIISCSCKLHLIALWNFIMKSLDATPHIAQDPTARGTLKMRSVETSSCNIVRRSGVVLLLSCSTSGRANGCIKNQWLVDSKRGGEHQKDGQLTEPPISNRCRLAPHVPTLHESARSGCTLETSQQGPPPKISKQTWDEIYHWWSILLINSTLIDRYRWNMLEPRSSFGF